MIASLTVFLTILVIVITSLNVMTTKALIVKKALSLVLLITVIASLTLFVTILVIVITSLNLMAIKIFS